MGASGQRRFRRESIITSGANKEGEGGMGDLQAGHKVEKEGRSQFRRITSLDFIFNRNSLKNCMQESNI